MESKVTKNTLSSSSWRVNLSGNSAALSTRLQQQISRAMVDSGIPQLILERIPLERCSDNTGVAYRSAIALKLSRAMQQSPLAIAHQLTVSLPTITQDGGKQNLIEFEVEVAPPGWINFWLTDQGLATWLQDWIQPSTDTPISFRPQQGQKNLLPYLELNTQHSAIFSQDTSKIFRVQYAHARCCSLLRLAHRQGLIQIQSMDLKTSRGLIVVPYPIPWLKDDLETGTNQPLIQLLHPAERLLIGQLMDLTDYLSGTESKNWLKLASSVSNAFEQFYRRCRIWGEVKHQTPRLAQARLGLVGVTQVVLRSLLEDQLGVPAPGEL
ncbi:DALR anticodon-binding domain-containing protein [Moorena bouillonii]|nr:DALR anticodon-binding domain-containing protein [Moorena bouillonii]